MKKDLLNQVGAIVGSDIHGLSSWIGETDIFYIETDTDPRKLFFDDLKKHVIRIEKEPFDGGFRIIAFKKTQ